MWAFQQFKQSYMIVYTNRDAFYNNHKLWWPSRAELYEHKAKGAQHLVSELKRHDS